MKHRSIYYRVGPQCKALYCLGLSPEEISRRVGVSAVSIRKWAREYGWQQEREAADAARSDGFQREFEVARLDEMIREATEWLSSLKKARRAINKK